MLQSKKIIKIMSFVLFVIVVTNSVFAAIVSDNDGSAFVTKAEFETLKTNFANQIEQYNTSIDKRIDGAIASYLAGLLTSTTEEIGICEKTLSYPMTLRMLGPYNGDLVRNITNENSSQWANGGLWTDGYDIFFYGSRNHIHHWANSHITKSPINTIKNFYNGSVQDGKFFIINMYNNYNIKACMNTSDHQFGQVGGVKEWESYSINIFFDQSSCQSSGQQSVNSFNRKDIIYATNARKFTFPQDNFPYVYDVWMNFRGQGKLTVGYPSLTSTSGIDKKWNIIARSSDCQGYREPTQRHSSWTQIASYDSGLINDVFLGSLSSTNDTDLYMPVLYNGKIKLTNINSSKTNMVSTRISTTGYCGFDKTWNQQNVYIDSVIDPGLVIEPESNISSGWNNASLIKADRCYYKETWPVENKKEDFHLTDGIPLCDIPRETSKLKISLIPTWNSSLGDEKRYIMFSKEAITETTNRPDLSPKKDKYYDIKKTIDGVKSKYFELENNVVNSFYIEDLQKNDKVYFKIVWETGASTDATNFKKTTMISRPECVATFS